MVHHYAHHCIMIMYQIHSTVQTCTTLMYHMYHMYCTTCTKCTVPTVSTVLYPMYCQQKYVLFTIFVNKTAFCRQCTWYIANKTSFCLQFLLTKHTFVNNAFGTVQCVHMVRYVGYIWYSTMVHPGAIQWYTW